MASAISNYPCSTILMKDSSFMRSVKISTRNNTRFHERIPNRRLDYLLLFLGCPFWIISHKICLPVNPAGSSLASW